MGASHKVVFLDRASLKATVRQPACAERYVEHAKTSAEQIVEHLAGATVAITNKVPLRAETLAQLPALKMIAVAATGYDVIDVPYCREHGIAVANIRNYAVHTVPEHAFALILALRRSLLAYRADVEAGVWNRAETFCFFDHPIGDLHGSTLGIVGEGAIGQGTAAIARGFGMNVLFADHEPPKAPGVEFTPMDEVLARSDVLSLHLRLAENTRGIVKLDALSRMKPTALLVNTSRAELIEEGALVGALNRGRPGMAAVDVFESEPILQGHALLRLENCICTPHIGYVEQDSYERYFGAAFDNVVNFIRGTPTNVVNPGALQVRR